MIDVLLATCEGELFLEEQLTSLFRQSSQEFRLLVRDDDSSDMSAEIVRRYVKRYPGRVMLSTNPERLGPVGNFALLLCQSTAEYVMFCDQDDVWLPHKIATNLRAMKDIESRLGSSTPILVYSDLKVVACDLKVISDTFWMGMRPPAVPTFAAQLAANRVTGCTAMMNRALVERALPIPIDQVFMHDWWIGLVAAAFGVLYKIDEPLLLYRQHGRNTVGVRKSGKAWLPKLSGLVRRFGLNPNSWNIELVQRLARAFESQFETELSKQQQHTLRAAQELLAMGPFRQRWTIARYGLFQAGFKSNIKVFLGA